MRTVHHSVESYAHRGHPTDAPRTGCTPVTFLICGSVVLACSLVRHQDTQKCKAAAARVDTAPAHAPATTRPRPRLERGTAATQPTRVKCTICGSEVLPASMAGHLTSQKCQRAAHRDAASDPMPPPQPKVRCDRCNAEVLPGSMTRHQNTLSCKKAAVARTCQTATRNADPVATTSSVDPKARVDCGVCGASIQQCNLVRHQGSARCQRFNTSVDGKVQCDNCGMRVRPGGLKRHKDSAQCRSTVETSHEPAISQPNRADTTQDAGPRDAHGRPMVHMPRLTGNTPTACPFGCPVTFTVRATMRTHMNFVHHCTPCFDAGACRYETECPICHAFVRRMACHKESDECRRLAEQRERAQRLDAANVAIPTFTLDGETLERVTQFKYLGCVVSDECDDDHAIHHNIVMARQKLACIQPLLRSRRLPLHNRLRFIYVIVTPSIFVIHLARLCYIARRPKRLASPFAAAGCCLHGTCCVALMPLGQAKC